MKRFQQPVSPIRCQANLSKKKSSFVVVEGFFSGSVEGGGCVGWDGVGWGGMGWDGVVVAVLCVVGAEQSFTFPVLHGSHVVWF